MEPAIIAAVLGLLGSVTGAVLSIWHGVGKSHAEAMLVKRLRSDRNLLNQVVELQRKLEREEKDVSSVYSDYFQTLRSAAAALPEPDRKRVLEGLEQSSVTGRSNYVQKLIQESTSATPQQAG